MFLISGLGSPIEAGRVFSGGRSARGGKTLFENESIAELVTTCQHCLAHRVKIAVSIAWSQVLAMFSELRGLTLQRANP